MPISAAELAVLLGQPSPTDEQAIVIESGLEPAAVIAGAGSGKTETMAARVVWLVANRVVAPDAVLGLTFTRKAAAELGGRVRRRLAQWRRVVERDDPGDLEMIAAVQSLEPTVLTYAAYAGRLVSEQALRIGLEPDATLLSPALLWQLADTVVRGWEGDLAEFNAVSSLVQWVIGLSGELADHLVEPERVARFCDDSLQRFRDLPPGPKTRSEMPNETGSYVTALVQRRSLVPLMQAFSDAKRARTAMDFGDQMRAAARLADLPEVVEVERARYRAVLLDEYQDTGHAQITLLTRLFGGGHPVTAVGDPFQSIYGWRGASAGNMARFDVTFPQADLSPAAVHPLATSFRNDRSILVAANAVAAPLRAQLGLVPLRPHAGSGNGVVATGFHETVEDEAAWVAQRLRAGWDELREGQRTAAVLVRRRSQMAILADAVGAAGLPVEIVGLGGLLTTPEVVDVVATLRVLADVRSGGAVMRLLTGARWRVGPRDLAELRSRAVLLVRPEGGGTVAGGARDEPASLVEALDDLGPAQRYSVAGYRRLSRLSVELRALRRRIVAPLAELVAEVEHAIGVDIEVEAAAGRARVGRVHLDRFLDVAAGFAAEAGDASLRAFLAYLEAAEEEENGLEAGEVEVAPERVQILTVHGAKGLEWDLVAVPGLASEVFPSKGKGIDWTRARHELPGPLRGDAEGLPPLDLDDATSRKEIGDELKRHHLEVLERHDEEERRLAYVALTRARSLLLASGYAWDTTKGPRTPSPYLETVAELNAPDTWFVPEPDASNPRIVDDVTTAWPVDPLETALSPGRRAAVERGATLVRDAVARSADMLPGMASLDDTAGQPGGVIEVETDTEPVPSGLPARWARDVDLLLDERARLRQGPVIDVELPAAVSVSTLVELRRDPDDLARRLHRPMPSPPAPWARRGTAFHDWLERRWGAASLLDVDELPGAADDGAPEAPGLAELQESFLASAWASRTPADVEVPFEMTVGGRIVRGRMDAVFGSAQEGWVVVDWKTGHRPTGDAARAAAVQLAAYRLAWARLRGVPDAELSTVRAAFHYVRSNETVEPAELLDAEGLRALLADGSDSANPT